MIRSLSFLFLLALLPLEGPASVRADTTPPPAPYNYTTLQQLRDAEKLPQLQNYDVDLQRFVVAQAQLLLSDMYVHLDLKIKKFHVDPRPALKALDDELASQQTPMDPLVFHDQLARIFYDERDLHTVYSLPQPYACYATALPFSFDPVKDKSGPALAISKISTTAAVVALAPGLNQLSAGDVIETYDGIDPVKKLPEIDDNPGFTDEELGSGANPAALRRRAIEKLTYLSQTYDAFPENNTVTLRVRTLKDPAHPITVTFPWIVISVNACLNPTPATPTGTGTGKAPLSIEDYEHQFTEFFHPRHAEGVPSADPLLDLSSPINTKESILHYKLLTRKDAGQPDRTFGYIRLDSFEPTLPSDDVIALVQGLLTHELAGTLGLIIDIRNNGGGIIEFGEQLEQLFAPNAIATGQFRLRVTQSNADFLAGTNHFSDIFANLLKTAPAGAIYTDTAPLTTRAEANSIGQVYFKPVAVLTNSSCYSTCDMFTAGMQDNGVATIWAEDGNTGGGGANNVHYSDFEHLLRTDSTFKLPVLPNGQDIGIAWRQFVRARKHLGHIVLVEDTGVHADRGDTLPASAEDLSLNGLITVRTITDSLITEAARRTSSVTISANGAGDTLDLAANQQPALNATLGGTTEVETLLETQDAEKELGRANVDAASATPVTKAIPLTLPDDSSARLAFQGYLGKRPVWRKTLVYRRLPAPVTAPADVALGASGVPAGMGLYTPDVDPSNGWNVSAGQLRIGQGPVYIDSLTTDASLFVTIPAGTKPKLTFNAKIDTEADFDFLRVSAIAAGKETAFVALSGSIPDQPYSYDLSAYAGQTIELRFRFTSDAAVVASGVFIHDLSVK